MFKHCPHDVGVMVLNLKKRKILLDEPIKTLGEFFVAVKLHPEVTCSFSVAVEKDEE